ncbi:MAG TPA: succinyl-diaminopimelate desuccinylase [Alphaproteobacteria bacterium]|nr:succinyl-diaminopimelate desuccinylase [Alphaproteobacteria bacterium]
MSVTIDPVDLARALILCPSVTPRDAGALDVLEKALDPLGFKCHRLPFGGGEARVDNLYARLGSAAPHFCFAGHTDVVPVGDPKSWTVDPFGAELIDGQIWGRGAADMKSAIAAFVAAVARFLAAGKPPISRDRGSISLLITGDEEGDAVNGTAKVLEWLKARDERLDACLVGEPTNPRHLGDMIKIGRRGSLTAKLVVHGVQGHTAYPQLADNPVHRLVRMLDAVTRDKLDDGTEHFQPSNLQITSIDVGNPTSNVIPARAEAQFNLRFNDRHTAKSLEAWLRRTFDAAAEGGRYDLAIKVSGEAFLTPPGPFSALVARAVQAETGRAPALDTAGGTSDARFIKDYCPVAEFGLVGLTMHKADERAAVADIEALTRIYQAVLTGYFAGR